jgi:signal transduction histidine kinase
VSANAFEQEAGRLMDVVGTFKIDHTEDSDRAVALVKRVAVYAHAKGVDAACLDFNSLDGGFMSGDLFILALDRNGTTLASGGFPERRGLNIMQSKDANGKEFIREMIEIAHSKGKGRCDYLFPNPVTKQDEPKSTYVELVDGIVIGCGIYKKKAVTA